MRNVFLFAHGHCKLQWHHTRACATDASERGAELEVAHKCARWLHNPYRLGDPHPFRAGGRITVGPQMGKVAS